MPTAEISPKVAACLKPLKELECPQNYIRKFGLNLNQANLNFCELKCQMTNKMLLSSLVRWVYGNCPAAANILVTLTQNPRYFLRNIKHGFCCQWPLWQGSSRVSGYKPWYNNKYSMARSEISPLVALKGRPQCTNVLLDISLSELSEFQFFVMMPSW